MTSLRFALVFWIVASGVATAQVMTDDKAAGTIAVNVVDASGKPASGITIAGLWAAGGYRGDGDREKMIPVGPRWKTGPDGSVKVPVRGRRGPYVSGSAVVSFLTYAAAQKHAALALVKTKGLKKTVTLNLEPVVTVHGRFYCPGLKRLPRWANGYVFAFTADGKASVRIAASPTTDGKFKLKLPPGQYRQNCFGEEVELLPVDLVLNADEPDHDLGTVNLEASGIARAYAKAPPDWWVKETRGVKGNVEAGDFRGKWLLVIYWAWW